MSSDLTPPEPRPFGLRAPHSLPDRASSDGAWRSRPTARVEPEPPSAPRSALVGWAMKIGVVTAVVGLGATQYLSRATQGGADAQWREARLVDRGGAKQELTDPETTGSIGEAARGAALDPCQAPARLRASR